jgi:CRISPR-associated protein Cas1
VAATATISQLGFIHEDSGQSFVLDVADLVRDTVTVPSLRSAACSPSAAWPMDHVSGYGRSTATIRRLACGFAKCSEA